MANPYLPIPFARDGTKTPIAVTRTDGVVNLTQGYGDDYSRELGVDPAAKPVERDFQNWLYGILTENLIEWQSAGLPTYLSERQYDVGALIRYTSGDAAAMRVFRCIQRPPIGTIPTNVNFWEVQPTDAQAVARIPMIARGRIPTESNWNNLSVGVWFVDDPAIISSSTNTPPTNVPGYLSTFSAAGQMVQTYTGQNSQLWSRSSSGGAWTAWVRTANAATTLAGYGITDGMLALGMRLQAQAFNFNTALDSMSVGLTAAPANWADLGWPVAASGALLVYGARNATDTRVSQTFYTDGGAMYTRFGRASPGAPLAWTAWQRMLVDPQVVVDLLLPRDNTWTGANVFSRTIDANAGLRSTALNLIARQTPTFDAVDVGLRIQSGPNEASQWNWDLIMTRQGERGFFNRRLGDWDFAISPNDLGASLRPTTLALNAAQLANSGAVLQLCTSGGGTALNPAIYSLPTGEIGVRVINAGNNGYTEYSFGRNGTFTSTNALVANGSVYAGGLNGAVLQPNGNIGGSVWPTGDLYNYIESTGFVRTNGGPNRLGMYYDSGRIQFLVNNAYGGTPALTSEFANYWNKSEFLRPSADTWTSGQSTNGVFTAPAGGTWAYFAIGNDTSSNLLRQRSGLIAGGGTVNFNDNRSASILWWRVS